MTRPNPAKVMKATVPKDALMKGTHLNRPSYDILANEKSICNFYKNCYIKYDRKKKTQKILYLFFRFKIYMVTAAS